jgi:hypothetical protein
MGFLAALPAILAGAGGLANLIGSRRETTGRNNETARQDAEQARRAQARAALMSAILKSQGYEGLIDERTLATLYTRSGAREPQRSLFSAAGGALNNIGAGLTTRGNTQAGTASRTAIATSTGGADIWAQIEEALRQGSIPGMPGPRGGLAAP